MNIANLRVDYKRAELDEKHADADPVAQFSLWWDEASAETSGPSWASALSLQSTQRGA